MEEVDDSRKLISIRWLVRYVNGVLYVVRNHVARRIGLGAPPAMNTGEDAPMPRHRLEARWWQTVRWFHGQAPRSKLQDKLFTIIFGTNTYLGQLFDLLLLLAISFSVLLFMLESIPTYYSAAPTFFITSEWLLTLVFSAEYAARLYCSKLPERYMKSFYGMVDLLSTLPLYLELLFPGMHYLLVLRTFRFLRIFRILKLSHFLRERDAMIQALRASLYKIGYFLLLMLLLVSVIGTFMYIVESSDPTSGFVSIPKSIYWSIVTLTTVGYGDISPVTSLGQFLASVIMLLGYSIIAVPTGIVTAEMANQTRHRGTEKPNAPVQVSRKCKHCGKEQHAPEASFCDRCGTRLDL